MCSLGVSCYAGRIQFSHCGIATASIGMALAGEALIGSVNLRRRDQGARCKAQNSAPISRRWQSRKPLESRAYESQCPVPQFNTASFDDMMNGLEICGDPIVTINRDTDLHALPCEVDRLPDRTDAPRRGSRSTTSQRQ